MRYSISTNWNSYRHTSAEAMLEEILSLGFETVELGYALPRAFAETVIQWQNEGKIKISSLHAFCPIQNGATPTPELFSICDLRDHRRSRQGISAAIETGEYAARAGAKVVVMHAGRVPVARYVNKLSTLFDKGYIGTKRYERNLVRLMNKREKYVGELLDVLRESLDEILPKYEQLGITLALENLPTYDGIPSEPELEMLFSEYPTLGYWHDIGHGQVRHNLGHIYHKGIVKRFTSRIAGMHIHDVIEGMADHQMPPGGMVKFDMFNDVVKKDIPLVFEPSHSCDGQSIKNAVQFLDEIWQINAL
jgi:sugar phosphate isomerase/epimerase